MDAVMPGPLPSSSSATAAPPITPLHKPESPSIRRSISYITHLYSTVLASVAEGSIQNYDKPFALLGVTGSVLHCKPMLINHNGAARLL